MTFCVYTAYDADDRPLYVGFTGNLDRRLAAHRRASAWVAELDRIETVPYATKDEARAAEAQRIADLRPPHNIVHNQRPWFTEEDIERALVESCERSGVPLKIEDPTVLAKIAKISRTDRVRKTA